MTRIPSTAFQLRSLIDLRRNLSATSTLQQQIATGRRVQRPSDDPIAAARILPLRAELQRLDRISDNAQSAQSAIDLAGSTVSQVSDLLIRARELSIQAANSTVGGVERQTLANEVEQLLQQLIVVANSENGGRFLFGGTVDDRPPFERVDGPDGSTRVLYRGDRGRREIEVAPGLREATNFPGSEVFFAHDRGPTLLSGRTGLATIPGFDTGVGTDQLEVRVAGLRTEPPAVGIALGNATNEVVGEFDYRFTAPDQLQIGTGPTVTVTPGQNRIPVNGSGDEISLNLVLPITPTLGKLVVEAELTLDGGETFTRVDFQERLIAVEDSLDGSVLHLDVSGLRRAGVEEVTYQGTFDAFQALIEVRDALRATDGPGSAALQDRLQELVGAVDEAQERILAQVQDFGSRSQTLQLTQNRIATLQDNQTAELSRLEDTDLASAISELEVLNINYQAALQVTARALQTSLFNFLA
ncbi:MAG: flagellar hook-associated protein FlgL [Planctomycetota bacterium]